MVTEDIPPCLSLWVEAAATLHPEHLAYTFLSDGVSPSAALTYGQLLQQSNQVATRLLERGLAGRNVVLAFPAGLGFVVAFLGCLRAGAVAVPQPLPRASRTIGCFEAVLKDTRAPLVLTGSKQVSRLRGLLPLADFAVLEEWLVETEADLRFPTPSAGDLAFIQYTSGSTGDPKGVMVSNGNLVHNQLAIREAMGHRPGMVGVGWLPHFHDMGLVGNLLQPLCVGAQLIFMPPGSFAQSPLNWLRAISHYRATTSGGPNFAYDLCVERITDEQKASLDLSSWEVAFVGAEPVQAPSLERFARAFQGCGFRPQSWFPCYGMAESTLIASGRHGLKTTSVCAQSLRQGLWKPVSNGASQKLAVSCGTVPLAGAVRIQSSQPGQPGEILLASPSVARGYWEKPELSDHIFGASLDDDEGIYLRTGDLGVLHEGELYILGRLKEMMILRGQNFYPEDIEATAYAAHPGLEPGGTAAFNLDDDDLQLVIVQEVQRARMAELDHAAAAQAIERAVAQDQGIAVSEIVLVKSGQLARTTSGKVQRSGCRERFVQGLLEPLFHWTRQPQATATEPPWLTPQAFAESAPEHRYDLLVAALQHKVAQLVGCQPADLDPDQDLRGLGLDSLQYFDVKMMLDEVTAQDMDLDAFLDISSLSELVEKALANADLPVVEASPVSLSGRLDRPPQFAPGPNDVDMPKEMGQIAHDFLGWLQRLVTRHGDVVRLKLGKQRLFLLSHPDEVGTVLITRHDTWIRGKVMEPFQMAMGQNGLLTGEGATWKSQRQAVHPEFSPAMVTRDQPTLVAVVEQHLQQAQQQAAFDLLEWCKRLTLQVIMGRLFGPNHADLLDPLFEVVHDLDHFWNVPSIFLYAESEGYDEYRQSWQAKMARLDQLIYELLQRQPQPILGHYVAQGDRQRLRDAAVTFLLTGFDTAASGIYWTLDQLLAHPEAMDQAREQTPWLLASVQEALRLYPPVWYLGREAIRDTHLAGYVVPTGSLAITSPYLIHRNPRLWPDPEEFRPRRFIQATPPARKYLPFGLGMRMCLGKHMALDVMVTAVGQMLRGYRLQVVAAGDRGLRSDFTLAPRRPLQVRLEAR